MMPNHSEANKSRAAEPRGVKEDAWQAIAAIAMIVLSIALAAISLAAVG
jgi:hypothetical protein